MLKLYYGRESIDKEKFTFDSIEGEALLIVPDQFTLQAERDAFFYCDQREAFMDMEVTSFSRLGKRVFEEVGGSRVPIIDKQGRHILLTKILRDMEKTGEAGVYSGYSGDIGLVERLNDFISEMKQYGTTPEDVEDAWHKVDEKWVLNQKLEAITRIFQKYEEALKGKYVDTEDYAGLCADKMPKSRNLKGKSVWVYGFDTFTPGNLMLLQGMLRVASEVNIVLTWEPGGREDLFAPGDYMVSALREMTKEQVDELVTQRISSEYEVKKAAGLAEMEKRLFTFPPGKAKDSSGITLVRASNYYSEAATAAAEVIRLIREEEYKLNEIALIANDMDVAGSIYKRVFAEYGLRVFMDQKRNVLHSPAIVLIIALMGVVIKGYRQEEVMQLFKSGLWEVTEEETERLEIYAEDYRIQGAAWKKTFVKGKTYYGDKGLAELEEIRIRAIKPMEDFATMFREAKTVKEKSEVVYEFLRHRLSIPEKLENLMEDQIKTMGMEQAEETAQIWNVAVKVLDQMVAVTGEEKISMKEFYTLFKAGMESVEIGVLPPTVDGLIMGTMQRTRRSRIKAVLVMGVNDGVLPTGIPSEGLLTPEEKIQINEDKSLCREESLRSGEETLAIYRNLSIGTCHVWLSYSASDEKGKSLKPSVIFENIADIFSITPKKDIENDGEPLSFVGGVDSTLAFLGQAMRRAMEKDPCSEEVCEVVMWYRENCPKLYERLIKGLKYTNKVEAVGSTLAQRMYKSSEEKPFSFSPSRLETFGRCPFSHFVKYGLKPEERRIYQVDALDMGDVYHQCLMILSQHLTVRNLAVTDPASPWMTISDEECRKEVAEILKEIGHNHREGILSGKGEEGYRIERMTALCARAANYMIQQVRSGEIVSMSYEVPFGRSHAMAPITVDLADGKAYIEGKIDRVDYLVGDNVKVIDYKSGRDQYSAAEVEAGWKLQLLIYLKAAATGHKPAGAFYFHINEPSVDEGKNQSTISKGGMESAMRKVFRMDGVTVNRSEVIEAIAGEFDGTSEIIPVRKDKEGNFVASDRGQTKLISEMEFEALMNRVTDRVDEMCRQIAMGNMDIQPRKTNARSACAYCMYKGICKFDLMSGQDRYINI